uniref:Uncharacterized protein n=1 Tax=viral metagenome TaxID=1070528 RepID=A0A6C0KLY7_9ZZZZ
MINESIGFIHVLFSFIISLYFLWRNDTFDIIYIVYFILLNLSWLIMKNECLISYIIKRKNDSDYSLGDSTNIEDYELILGEKLSEMFLDYIRFMYVFNISFILVIGDIDIFLKLLLGLFTFSCFFYMYSFKNTPFKKNTEYIKDVHMSLTIIVLSYILYLYSNPHFVK